MLVSSSRLFGLNIRKTKFDLAFKALIACSYGKFCQIIIYAYETSNLPVYLLRKSNTYFSLNS